MTRPSSCNYSPPMPKHLTAQQVSDFEEQGFLSPVDIMSEDDAVELARELEDAEGRFPAVLDGRNRNNTHLVLSFMDRIAFNETILDVVEDVLGPDILLWGTVLFIKEPDSPHYVSWHQDATYMGLEPHEGVTPWLALSPSDTTSGCMRMIPGSHRWDIQAHSDTFAEDNILTRGQNIEGVDEDTAVDLVLRPGQLSIHHPRTIHSSRPNRSNYRRMGIALQLYMRPDVRQVVGKGLAMHCRGVDRFGYHQFMSRPSADMTDEGIRQWQMANDNWNDILYAGAEQTRNF